ncbi:DnaB-like helicase N-terminal domain-containing protein [Streptomyces sp. NPDC001255]|uniref:DnaB-like helicase N-terminal domain-containing protein n=1 Tax=Streptomyces sp. NPDC001255 TaxID=3364550 RepID=UPI0036825CFE
MTPNPPLTPLVLVEQALLGSLLLDPSRLAELKDSLTPAAFSIAVHSAVFAAIQELPAPDPVEHIAGPAWLDKVLATASSKTRGVDAPYLHTLIQATRGLGHLPAYSTLIADAHARRRLHDRAVHLAGIARDASFPDPVATALRAAEDLRAELDAWSPPTTGVRAPPRPDPPATASQKAVDRAADDELHLIASAVAHPEEAAALRAWIRADEDFTNPIRAGLWKSVTALLSRHAAVDPLTLLCEAQHHGVLADADPRPLLATLSQPAGDLTYWAAQVLSRSVLATADRTGRAIAHYAAEATLTPTQVSLGSHRALAHFDAVRVRWQHVTAPPPAHRETVVARPGPRSTAPRTRTPVR